MFPAIIGALGRVAGSAAVKAVPQGALGSNAMSALSQSSAIPMPAGGGAAPAVDKVATGLTGLTDKLKPLAGAIGGVQGKLEGLSATAGKVASAAGLVTEPLQAVVGVMGTFRDSVTALGNQVSQFTRLANPALTQRFFAAADDLTASIGRGLLPVLQFATRFTRMFGDAIFTVSGPIARLTDTFLGPISGAFEAATNAVGPLVRNFGRMIDVVGAVAKPFWTLGAAIQKIGFFALEVVGSGIGAAIEFLTTPLMVAAKLFGELATAIDKFITRNIGSMRGLLGAPAMAGASVGAAVRNVSTGSVESFQNKAITQAFSLGTASSPEERTASLADQIVSWLKGPGTDLISKLPAELGKVIMDAIEKLPGVKSVKSAVESVSNAPESAKAAGMVALMPGVAAIEGMRRLADKGSEGKGVGDWVGGLYRSVVG